MQRREVKIKAQWHRIVIAGGLFSAVLLLSAVLVAWRTVEQIDLRAAEFSERETAAQQAIESIEEKQHELNDRWLRLAHKRGLRPARRDTRSTRPKPPNDDGIAAGGL